MGDYKMKDIASENALQRQCIELFKAMGYEYISRENVLTMRGNDTSKVLLREILQERLNALNSFEIKGQRHTFSPANIEKAINELEISSQQISNGGLLKINEKLSDKFKLGASFEENINGIKKSFSLRYIDFENIENNTFSVSDEFSVRRCKVDKDKEHRRADLVLFINGIPFVIIELKKSSRSYEFGIKQLEMYQQDSEIAQLFASVQLCIAASYDAKYGTVKTPNKFYSLWREEDENLRQKIQKLITKRTPTKCDEMLVALCDKERLLRLVKHYVLFDKGLKKVCRYQQFFAIECILARVENLNDGKRKGGLVWHTQGSGKSLTMIMLTRLLQAKFPQSKIIVVSDRIDLDEQIKGTFENTQIKVAQAKSSKDLLDKLKSGASVISTLVHKFERLKGVKKSASDSFYANADIFVLVDESHRTQSGELHRAMKKALPNACYIGFTGTPLMKSEKNSFAKFGGEIHRYTIQQAINDKAIVPLRYENRFVNQNINDKNALDKRFDAIARKLTAEQKVDLKRKWAKFQKIASSENRLFLIALDISEHFKQNLQGLGFKGILATNSKYEAMRYYEIFKECMDLKTAPIISSNEQEGFESERKSYVIEKWKAVVAQYASDEERYIKHIKDEFINGDEVDLLIVVDKLLTGFDAPRAKVLYIDKSLKEHNLLQAIARVNRLCEGKDSGIIIDYRGLLGHLDKALSDYAPLNGFDEEDLTNAVIDIKKAIQEAKNAYESLNELFAGAKKNDKESYITLLQDTEKRAKFKEILCEFSNKFALSLGSECIEEVLSEREIAEFKARLKFYNELRKEVQLRFCEACDFGEFEAQMQKLLDSFVNANEINTLGAIPNIFDDDFEKQVSHLLGVENLRARADSLLSAISSAIQEKVETNPAFYKSLAAQIEKILQDYKNKRINDEQKLNLARQTHEKLLQQTINAKESYPKEIAQKDSLIAFYDNLCELFGGVLKNLAKDEFEKIIVNLSLKADELYMSFCKKPQWFDSIEVKNEVETKLEDSIWELEDKFGFHLSEDESDKIYKILRNIAVDKYAKTP